jgi:hypothetical protein
MRQLEFRERRHFRRSSIASVDPEQISWGKPPSRRGQRLRLLSPGAQQVPRHDLDNVYDTFYVVEGEIRIFLQRRRMMRGCHVGKLFASPANAHTSSSMARLLPRSFWFARDRRVRFRSTHPVCSRRRRARVDRTRGYFRATFSPKVAIGRPYSHPNIAHASRRPLPAPQLFRATIMCQR